MIEVEGLRKRYDTIQAVDGVDIRIEAGQVFGLLGPNGAGKSTVLGCLAGLVEPDEGRLRLAGVDLSSGGPEARRSLGLVPQDLAFYTELDAAQNLRYWGTAQGMSRSELRQRIPELLSRVGLADRASEPTRDYSGGMMRRLNFACGIVHRPKMLLLDEPTVGVDPQSRVKLLELVRELARGGCCVLYTTHYMEEAEELCDRIAILDDGRILAQGTLPELRARVGERDLLRFSGRFEPDKIRQKLAEAPSELGEVEIIQADEVLLTLALASATNKLPGVVDLLYATGAELRDTRLREPSLETLFIRLTGKELRE